MALPQQFLPTMSAEQYLRLERASEDRHEFVDGIVYAMAGESPDHSTICYNLAGITHAQLTDKPCRGFSPNMKVRTNIGDLYAYPDLMIICGEPKFHDKKGDVLLNPTVIFEVLSPSTERYDRGEKFRRYRTQIESLAQYVMVSQDRIHVEVFHRGTETWNHDEIDGEDGLLTLRSIECALLLKEIYRNTELTKHIS
ncbi:MAG TPA: Uma2 family endonuclease [Pyrinomonadaceae bacterium]|nr:Uma2 family endonuclease [Pyrinomonadaceae bacterium]